MYRWCQQSLSSSLSPPSRAPLKSSTGLRRRGGSWVFPPSPPAHAPSLFPSSSFLPPVLGEAGARRQAVLFLLRIDLTLLCFGLTGKGASQVLSLLLKTSHSQVDFCRLVLIKYNRGPSAANRFTSFTSMQCFQQQTLPLSSRTPF